MEQNLVLRVNAKSWVGFRLVNIFCFEHVAFCLNPKFVGFCFIVNGLGDEKSRDRNDRGTNRPDLDYSFPGTNSLGNE